MQGYVHSFESLAAVDGEGLRCAVFLAGCPLRCVYCHNPDTWTCEAAKLTDSEALARKIVRYKPYFGSDGGVTFSGGEPLMQADFINETAEFLRSSQVSYTVDTSGAVPLNDNVRKALDHSSHVILDLKFWDDASYLKYTGSDMTSTLNMLDYLEETGKNTWVRTVVVPGINDCEDILGKYAHFVKGKKCISRYELLGFHTMGFSKYDMLGKCNPLAGTPALDAQTKNTLQQFINRTLGM